ncbi:MAG: RelA/SpoT family protein [Hyphomicrobiaceae bacterium]
MRQYELVERVLAYNPNADEALLNRAYVYAMKAHSHQRRASGDPYFSHPLEVAAILTELKLDDATIAAGLLHDTIEDTDVTRAEIDRLFGTEIGALVDGLTKIKKLDLISKKAEQAENFRKLLIAISSDIRVLLVKLADRLHNMRTIEPMKPESRRRISEETLEIYAPMAGRMGMQALREELEDHAFRWLQPDAYKLVTARLEELRVRNKGLVEDITHILTGKLAEVSVDAKISSREKKPYSVWRKMENRQISLEQLSDIYAFRILVAEPGDCYRALGVIHTSWSNVPGRFKDYISTPKQNGYQSIHTTIVGPRYQRVELQVRTHEMHLIAEYGVAAHALYKDLKATANSGGDAGPYIWLRRLVEAMREAGNPEEFLEHTKLELFQDQVFCFTPKASLIALPRGATPIDFAYAVHTDIGDQAVGALVNGRQLPMTTVLRNGDEVQILTSKGRTPPSAWERIAVTGRARSAVRRATREAVRRQYNELGRRLIASRLEHVGLEYSEERLRKVLPRLGQKTVEDTLAAVGRNELALRDVLKAIAPEHADRAGPAPYRPKNRHDHGQGQDGWFNLARVMGLKFRLGGVGEDAVGRAGGVPIRGFQNDVPVSFADGGAVPGDRIVGVMTPGEGIRIFQIHSPRLGNFEHEHWIDVTWDVDPNKPERFPARIRVVVLNEPGTLAQIAQVIGDADGNIDNLKMTRRASDFTEMLIELEVWDLEHLTRIVSGLKAKAAVNKVERVFD